MERQKHNPKHNFQNQSFDILDRMDIPFCRSNLDGKIITKNQPFISKCVPPNADFSSLNLYDLGLRSNLEKLNITQPSESSLHSFIGQDGQAHWYNCETKAFFDSQNQALNFTSIFLDGTQLHEEIEKLKQLSLKDKLTGLYNRNFIDDELRRLDSKFNRRSQVETYSIIYCDLNNFKEINDTFGHDAGDKIIIKTAKLIQENCRDCDLVARLHDGGDEFIIVLPKTNEKEALVVKNRIYDSFMINGISLAMGVSQRRFEDVNYKDVERRADSAMYFEKNNMKSVNNNI